jgi:two-component system, cell cycle response regulator
MNKAVILLISDDSSQRKCLADILEVNGYKTLLAKDEAEGLSIMQKSTVALTLIDLPNTSWLDVLSTDHQSPATIILTGEATLESAIEATNRGAFSYLLKPCETRQLLLQIRRALEKQQADAALKESEAKFRELVESAPGAMLLINDRQDILMVNKQFEVLFDYDRSEVIGRQIEEILTPPPV